MQQSISGKKQEGYWQYKRVYIDKENIPITGEKNRGAEDSL